MNECHSNCVHDTIGDSVGKKDTFSEALDVTLIRKESVANENSQIAGT